MPQPLYRRARRQHGALTVASLAFAVALLAAASAGAAERRTVVDPNTPPWDAVARIQTNIGTRCTGVLIAPATVLTAAHCLYNPRTRAMLEPLSLHVLFGFQRNGYRWHRLVARDVVGAGFDGRVPRPQPSDWARLDLAEPVPVKPLPVFGGTIVPGLPVVLAGYNQDRTQLLLADLSCQALRTAAVGGGIFVIHDCAGTHGTSGGPLLTRQNARWAVVAINVAAGPIDNLALVVPPVK